MVSIKRISFYGGAGIGKSTLAPRIFSEMKKLHYKVEYVGEWIKKWACEGREVDGFDQLKVLGEQVFMEEDWLRNGNDFVVCECPLLMCTAYATWHNAPCALQYLNIAKEFEELYPSLNFFIDRTVPYVDEGRYQTKDQAEEFDGFLKGFLEDHLQYDLHHVEVNQIDSIMSTVGQFVKEQ